MAKSDTYNLRIHRKLVDIARIKLEAAAYIYSTAPLGSGSAKGRLQVLRDAADVYTRAIDTMDAEIERMEP
jgi:hypothetical protein